MAGRDVNERFQKGHDENALRGGSVSFSSDRRLSDIIVIVKRHYSVIDCDDMVIDSKLNP